MQMQMMQMHAFGGGGGWGVHSTHSAVMLRWMVCITRKPEEDWVSYVKRSTYASAEIVNMGANHGCSFTCIESGFLLVNVLGEPINDGHIVL